MSSTSCLCLTQKPLCTLVGKLRLRLCTGGAIRQAVVDGAASSPDSFGSGGMLPCCCCLLTEAGELPAHVHEDVTSCNPDLRENLLKNVQVLFEIFLQ